MTGCNISYPIIYQIFSYYCEKDKLYSIKTISKDFSNSFNKLNIKKCNVIKFRNLIVCKEHGDPIFFDGIKTLLTQSRNINSRSRSRSRSQYKKYRSQYKKYRSRYKKSLPRYKNTETIHFNTKESLNSVKHYLHLFGIVSHFCCSGSGVVYKDKDD